MRQVIFMYHPKTGKYDGISRNEANQYSADDSDSFKADLEFLFIWKSIEIAHI